MNDKSPSTRWSREGILAAEAAHTSGLYHKRPLVLTRGRGALVWDMDGSEYIDCDTGHGVAILGHCHPKVVAAVQAQVEQMITCHESFFSEPRARFLDVLASVLPQGLDRVFLCNSGTEAVEAAIKFARLATGRSKVVATKRGFHGRTLGSLSATWNPRYREPFLPLLPGFSHITYNNCEEASSQVTGETAAVILELVQGESGVFVAEPGFVRHLRQLCDECGAMLIFDEVQTGVGRTGTFVAAQGFDVIPDILCLAKGLAGGVPFGATCFGPRLGELPGGVHASTFGGNPVACAAAAATIEAVVSEGLAGRAAEMGSMLFARFHELAREFRVVREVRGLGLMVGIDLKVRAARYLQALQDHGVLALSAGPTVVRLLPPLVIEKRELETVCDRLAAVFRELPYTTPAS